LLSHSRGTSTYFHEEDGRFAIQTVADVEPTLDFVRDLHNAGMTKRANGDRHLAEIPIVVLNAWAISRGTTFDAVMRDARLMREFLQDPDHSHFRVDKGRI
jgi:hypothetical protein